MATYRKDTSKTPLLVHIIFIALGIILIAAIIYPAYAGAVINLKTGALEFPNAK